MKPLIEIKTVPISIQYQTSAAQIQRKNMTAEVEISRNKKGLSIRSRPIQLNIDTFEARNSISPTPMRSMQQSADAGMQAAYNTTATIAREGSMMVDIHLNQNIIPQLAAQNTNPKLPEFNIGFIPSEPIELNWVPSDLQIEYEMDKLTFDWKTNQREFEFTPADIQFVIEERPHVVIEYVGDPIYVPPSANPGYEPIDVLA